LSYEWEGTSILLGNGCGGDRSQTVEALETILDTLSSEGYVFEAVCP